MTFGAWPTPLTYDDSLALLGSITTQERCINTLIFLTDN